MGFFKWLNTQINGSRDFTPFTIEDGDKLIHCAGRFEDFEMLPETNRPGSGVPRHASMMGCQMWLTGVMRTRKTDGKKIFFFDHSFKLGHEYWHYLANNNEIIADPETQNYKELF